MKTNTSMVARSQEENWQPILELALQEVFEIMLGCRLEPSAGAEHCTDGEITAMVGLAGSACGVLTVCCSDRTATAVAKSMLGAETVRTQDDVCDALGELCNMIAGNFKNKLSGVDGTCLLSVPTVITGGEYSFHSLADGGALETIMLFEGKPVIVRLDLHS